MASLIPVSTKWCFNVEYIAKRNVVFDNSPAILTDFAVFSKILDIKGTASPRIKLDTCYGVRCNFEDSDPKYAEILGILKAAGWSPVFSILRANNRHPGEFLVERLISKADPKEINSAPFLAMHPDIHGGYQEHRVEDEIWVSCQDDEAKKRTQVVWLPGSAGPFYLGGWSHDARDALEAAGLVGAKFCPLKWVTNHKRVVSQPYYLDSEVRFPRSHTPRCVGAKLVDAKYLAKHGEPDTYQWDDEARSINVRMHYTRSEIENMKGIDIARTFEGIPEDAELGRRYGSHLLVSQKFRKWANKMGYKFHWTPIVVVDD
jgi:hypothetical protein